MSVRLFTDHADRTGASVDFDTAIGILLASRTAMMAIHPTGDRLSANATVAVHAHAFLGAALADHHGRSSASTGMQTVNRSRSFAAEMRARSSIEFSWPYLEIHSVFATAICAGVMTWTGG